MMWVSDGADAEEERTFGFHDPARHLASESSSSSDSENSADGGALRSSPARSSSSNLASPSSSSSPPRPHPHPLSKGTLSEFLAWQLQQPVVHSLKTWLQGEETEGEGEGGQGTGSSTRQVAAEERPSPGLWSWCLGGNESFWGLDGYSEEEEEEEKEGAAHSATENWLLRTRNMSRPSETTLRQRRGGGVSAGGVGMSTCSHDRGISRELLLLLEHQPRDVRSSGGSSNLKASLGSLHRTCSDPLAARFIAPGLHSDMEWVGRSGSRSSPPTPSDMDLPGVGVSSSDAGNVNPSTPAQSEEKAGTPATEGKKTTGGVKGQVQEKKGVTGKLASFFERLSSTLWMVGGFWCLGYMGHLWMWGLVLVLQVMMTQELFALARQNLKLPGSESFPQVLDWHFVVTAMVYMYGHLMEQHLIQTAAWDVLVPYPFVSQSLIFYSKNHCFMSYALYLVGFVGFVLLLEDGKYMGQLAHLAWNHLLVFLVVCQSSFFAPNIFQGLGWFLLATMIVIANDCGAYLFGFFLGRTPLIRVSPKKTWEGFLGGALITAVFAFLFSGFLGHFKWMTCPRTDFSWGPLQCVPDPMFSFTPHRIPNSLQPYLPGWAHVWWISGFQKHALGLAGFASTVAPFGGFFASGVKRALGIKDFGNLIPGHGGITDRMDCQLLMAFFSYVYIQSFVVPATGA